MPKVTIEMDDTLQDSAESAIEQLKEAFKEYILENPDNDDVCLSNDIDYSGRFHEIVDGSVPIYTKEIDDIWYLHANDLEEAYENAGIGDNPRENNGMVAIYCYIQEQCWEWWHDNHESIQEQLNDFRDNYEDEEIDDFEDGLSDFLDTIAELKD